MIYHQNKKLIFHHLIYQYEESLKNLNYNIIQNLKNFEQKLKSNKIEIYERVYNEGKKYISLIQNLQNKKSNYFTNFICMFL